MIKKTNLIEFVTKVRGTRNECRGYNENKILLRVRTMKEREKIQTGQLVVFQWNDKNEGILVSYNWCRFENLKQEGA